MNAQVANPVLTEGDERSHPLSAPPFQRGEVALDKGSRFLLRILAVEGEAVLCCYLFSHHLMLIAHEYSPEISRVHGKTMASVATFAEPEENFHKGGCPVHEDHYH